MQLECIGTGSSGNCYLIKVGSSFIILDCGVPRSADDRFIERLELERKLRDLNNIINALQDVQDYLFKDTAKALIELIDNETQKDILKQYYVYKKSATQIAYENYYSIDTIKQYRKRGLKAIVEVWKNQVKK